MGIVDSTFVDLTPKVVLFTMVKQTDEFLSQGKLTSDILDSCNNEAYLEDLVKPDGAIVRR